MHYVAQKLASEAEAPVSPDLAPVSDAVSSPTWPATGPDGLPLVQHPSRSTVVGVAHVRASQIQLDDVVHDRDEWMTVQGVANVDNLEALDELDYYRAMTLREQARSGSIVLVLRCAGHLDPFTRTVGPADPVPVQILVPPGGITPHHPTSAH